MTGESPDSSKREASNEAAQIGTPYKILGDLDDSADGIGVLGRNTAGSGVTRGVEGRVDSPNGYGLYTPDDAKIGGTTDLSKLLTDTIDTGGNDFTLLAGTSSTGSARNVIQGHTANEVTDNATGGTISGGGYYDGSTVDPNRIHDNFGTVSGGRQNEAGSPSDNDNATAEYATVGGGRFNMAKANYATIAGGGPSDTDNQSGTNNVVHDNYGTIGGGGNNQAGNADNDPGTATYATVAGGRNNRAIGQQSTVGGGRNNEASAQFATVAGGRDNTAQEPYSYAGGRAATAQHEGAIVWGDSTTTSISSSNIDEFRIQHDFYAASVTEYSARAAKTNVDPVDPESVLEGVEALDVSRWQFKRDVRRREDPPRHLGPMAEDFAEQFGVGHSDEHITNVDANGVAFAAVQGLAERLERTDQRFDQLDTETESLREETEHLREETENLREETESLRETNDRLRERLSTLESRIDTAAPADD